MTRGAVPSDGRDDGAVRMDGFAPDHLDREADLRHLHHLPAVTDTAAGARAPLPAPTVAGA
jgi:hypothetical protein